MALYTATPPEGATQKIWGHLAPYPGENYPTHHDTNMKGGYRSIATGNDVNTTVPTSHRKHGMLIYCRDTNITYRLGSNLVSWTQVVASGSAAPLPLPYERVVNWGSVNAEYRRSEYHKYPEGRMEYLIYSGARHAHQDYANFWYSEIGHFAYPYHFNQDPFVFFGMNDTAGGLCWASASGSTPNMHGIFTEITATAYNAGGEVHIRVVGRWK